MFPDAGCILEWHTIFWWLTRLLTSIAVGDVNQHTEAKNNECQTCFGCSSWQYKAASMTLERDVRQKYYGEEYYVKSCCHWHHSHKLRPLFQYNSLEISMEGSKCWIFLLRHWIFVSLHFWLAWVSKHILKRIPIEQDHGHKKRRLVAGGHLVDLTCINSCSTNVEGISLRLLDLIKHCIKFLSSCLCKKSVMPLSLPVAWKPWTPELGLSLETARDLVMIFH